MAATPTLCSHGREGFCWDDLTPAERESADFIFRHAFDWAAGGDLGEAEAYASWYVRTYGVDVEEVPNHRTAWEAFLASK
jgi:hypothetical protein